MVFKECWCVKIAQPIRVQSIQVRPSSRIDLVRTMHFCILWFYLECPSKVVVGSYFLKKKHKGVKCGGDSFFLKVESTSFYLGKVGLFYCPFPMWGLKSRWWCGIIWLGDRWWSDVCPSFLWTTSISKMLCEPLFGTYILTCGPMRRDTWGYARWALAA